MNYLLFHQFCLDGKLDCANKEKLNYKLYKQNCYSNRSDRIVDLIRIC